MRAACFPAYVESQRICRGNNGRPKIVVEEVTLKRRRSLGNVCGGNAGVPPYVCGKGGVFEGLENDT